MTSQPNQPPRGRRITLRELMLSVFLVALGMGLFRLAAEWGVILFGDVNWNDLYATFATIACVAVAIFIVGGGIYIPVARIAFKDQHKTFVLVLFGGFLTIVLICGFGLCLFPTVIQ